MSYDIIEKLKKEIGGFKDEARWSEVGRIIEVGDGIVKLQGLPKTVSQELLTIETSQGKRRAMVLNLEEETIGALVLDDYTAIKSGDTVRGTGKVLDIGVGPELLGRVIDPLGNPLDGLGDIFPAGSGSASGGKNNNVARYTLENKAPSVLDREPVGTP
ncbi:MAG: hypothetical protein AAB867_03235, partial [Patescibacteria group bacterium]